MLLTLDTIKVFSSPSNKRKGNDTQTDVFQSNNYFRDDVCLFIGNTMTVRRYSISSLHAFTVGNKRHKSPDQNRTHQRSRQEGPESTTVIHPYTTMKVTKGQGVPDELLETKSPEGKQPQDTPLQEYVPKCK